MTDTPDFSTFNWPNSQQSAQTDPADPSTYSSHQSYGASTSQRNDTEYVPQRPSSANGHNGPSASHRESSDFSSFTFGQPNASQSGSQSGYYNVNGGVDTSTTNYGTSTDATAYTPIDPALTAPPPRISNASFSQDPSSQNPSSQSSYLSHLPPSNFNPGRRYSTPALSSTPYAIPRRQGMYPPGQYTQRPNETSPTNSPFAQPPPRSPAFSSPLRSFPQGFNAADRRMSMPTNSLWQLAHQSAAAQPQTSPVQQHTDSRPRQHSMVDWRLSQTLPTSRSTHANQLLADLDASQGMLSLRSSQWDSHPPSEHGMDFGSDMEDRRQGYDPGLIAAANLTYDAGGRRASVDSNATQPGSGGEGLKKHICVVCGKKFTRPSSLQTHMYSHTAFKCEHEGCGRSFSVVSNLRRHKKIHLNPNGR